MMAKSGGMSLNLADDRLALVNSIKIARGVALDQAKDKLVESGQNGQKAGRHLSNKVDEILGQIFAHCCNNTNINANSLALVAVGGYGRRQLAPGSDIDLLFLIPEKPDAQIDATIEMVLYLLWDSGFKVGQSTRSVSECVVQAKADVTISTTLLESRLLAGNLKLFNQLQARYKSQILAKEKKTFLDGKLAERQRRHNQAGASRFALEPNIKEGIGGLRDLQTLYWILKFLRGEILNSSEERERFQTDLQKDRVFSKSQAQSFIKAERFLWALRFHLHDLAGRAEERLTFDFQPDVAARMGYIDRSGQRAVERFMSHYFAIAKSVGSLTDIVLTSVERDYETKRRFRLPRYLQRQELVEGFVVKDKRVAVESRKALRDAPIDILRIFAVAQRHRMEIDPVSLRVVTQSLGLINRDFMNDPAANRLFVEMLTSRKDPGQTLRRLNDAGVLGRFIPDFGRIVGMMQFDRYHHFTVDEHTLFAIDNLWHLEQGTIAAETPLSTEFMGKIRSRTVLYVAVFLHDIAKGRNGPHELLGAEVALRLCPRFGLDEQQTEMVSWLVKYHLHLSNVILKRDIDDPQTVKDYAEHVESIEYARCLHILTSADIRAVGPGTWNSWKASMMRHMYAQTSEYLRGDLMTEGRQVRIKAVQEQVLEALGGTTPELKQFINRFPRSYWLSHATYDLVRQIPILRQADAEEQQLIVDVELPSLSTDDSQNVSRETNALENVDLDPQRLRDDLRLLVYLDDHYGIFTRVAGAIALSGGSIEDAKIHTLKHGRALQVYTIKAAQADASTLQALAQKLQRNLPLVLEGRMLIADELGKRANRNPKRLQVFERPAQAFVDNNAAERHTVIEVSGNDKLGSLYWITKALSDQNLQIHTAKVAPLGVRFVDVFYVQDLIGQKIRSAERIEQIKKSILKNLKDLS
ncbi:MAG: [protein-PII] uridylyltransferase [Alphaproteobacteria bacterium]